MRLAPASVRNLRQVVAVAGFAIDSGSASVQGAAAAPAASGQNRVAAHFEAPDGRQSVQYHQSVSAAAAIPHQIVAVQPRPDDVAQPPPDHAAVRGSNVSATGCPLQSDTGPVQLLKNGHIVRLTSVSAQDCAASQRPERCDHCVFPVKCCVNAADWRVAYL